MVVDVKNRTVVNKKIGDLLANKSFATAKEKISLIAALHAAERVSEDPLVLSEEEYEVILNAVMSGSTDNLLVDTGRYYINVGHPVGREEFLSIDGVSTTVDGADSYNWIFESFSQAKLFTKEEIDLIVPKAYRSEDYIIMENLAEELFRQDKNDGSEESGR